MSSIRNPNAIPLGILHRFIKLIPYLTFPQGERFFDFLWKGIPFGFTHIENKHHRAHRLQDDQRLAPRLDGSSVFLEPMAGGQHVPCAGLLDMHEHCMMGIFQVIFQ